MYMSQPQQASALLFLPELAVSVSCYDAGPRCVLAGPVSARMCPPKPSWHGRALSGCLFRRATRQCHPTKIRVPSGKHALLGAWRQDRSIDPAMQTWRHNSLTACSRARPLQTTFPPPLAGSVSHPLGRLPPTCAERHRSRSASCQIRIHADLHAKAPGFCRAILHVVRLGPTRQPWLCRGKGAATQRAEAACFQSLPQSPSAG